MKLAVPDTVKLAEVTQALRELRRFTCATAVTKRSRKVQRILNLTEFENLWWHDVVLGYGLAEKIADRRETGHLSVRLYVNRKLPKSKLKTAFRIPKTLLLRGLTDEAVTIKTDVVELNRIPVIHRTIYAGESMGHYIGMNGTFGLAVVDSAGRQYALTCAHVAAPYWLSPKGDPVESPADTDGKAGDNVMGTLADWSVLDTSSINTADAALVQPKDGVVLSNAHLQLGLVPRFANLTLSNFVAMKSRAVKIQSQRGTLDGVIDSVHNDLPFDFSGRYFRFGDIISYGAGVESGDSGSAVLDATSRDVLGLHFAGERAARIGYCIPARTILRTFTKYDLTIKP